jgi:hypothetical protein
MQLDRNSELQANANAVAKVEARFLACRIRLPDRFGRSNEGDVEFIIYVPVQEGLFGKVFSPRLEAA